MASATTVRGCYRFPRDGRGRLPDGVPRPDHARHRHRSAQLQHPGAGHRRPDAGTDSQAVHHHHRNHHLLVLSATGAHAEGGCRTCGARARDRRARTWGGLRRGLSLAMAPSLPESHVCDTILVLMYAVVASSILVQGVTLQSLISRLGLCPP